MPNMKSVCKTLDKMQKSISDLYARFDQLMKNFSSASFFSGGGSAPQTQIPSDGSAAAGATAAAAPVPPPPPSGPRAFMDESVFEGHEKQASQRKRKEFAEDFDSESEAEQIRRIVQEVQLEYLEDMNASAPTVIMAPGGAGPTSAGAVAQALAQAAAQAVNQAMGKPPNATTGGGAGAPPNPPQAPPQGGAPAPQTPGGPAGGPSPAGIPPNIVNFVNSVVSRSAVNLLTNVFGRRIANMLTPDDLHASDWLYMAQNVKWIDGKVASGINKSLADKVANGLMTQAQADAAGGFMSTEALGGQIAGGALIGLFIFQNIPKIATLLRDNVDFITGISDALFDTKTGKLMAYLDKIAADLNSIGGAAGTIGEFTDAMGVFDLTGDIGDVENAYDRSRSALSSRERIKEAGERYVKRKGREARAEIVSQQVNALFDSISKGLGFK